MSDLFLTASEKKKDKEYPPNFVTVYTDASVSPDGHHSFAFWAKSDWGTIKQAKICPPEISGIGQAEIYAICQGMHKAIQRWHDAYSIKGFYICSDSKHALFRLEKPYKERNSKNKPIPEVELRLKRAFDKMVSDNQFTMDMRHVPAHTGMTHKVRGYLNDWCDQNAKAAIRQHRRELSNR